MELREKYRIRPMNRYRPIKTAEGKLTSDTTEELKRWTERLIKTNPKT